MSDIQIDLLFVSVRLNSGERRQMENHVELLVFEYIGDLVDAVSDVCASVMFVGFITGRVVIE